MVKIGDLSTNKAVALEKIVLKNWSDCCEFFYDGCRNTCDVLIAGNVPIIIKSYSGSVMQEIFFTCGDETISIKTCECGYIIIT